MCLQLILRALTPPSGCGVALREDLIRAHQNARAWLSAVTESASAPVVTVGHCVIRLFAQGTVAIERAEASAIQ